MMKYPMVYPAGNLVETLPFSSRYRSCIFVFFSMGASYREYLLPPPNRLVYGSSPAMDALGMIMNLSTLSGLLGTSLVL